MFVSFKKYINAIRFMSLVLCIKRSIWDIDSTLSYKPSFSLYDVTEGNQTDSFGKIFYF